MKQLSVVAVVLRYFSVRVKEPELRRMIIFAVNDYVVLEGVYNRICGRVLNHLTSP